jgi:hypothetical protein
MARVMPTDPLVLFVRSLCAAPTTPDVDVSVLSMQAIVPKLPHNPTDTKNDTNPKTA